MAIDGAWCAWHHACAMKISACLLVFAALACAAQDAPRGRQPLVLIHGDGATYHGVGSTGKHDETMEMARDLLKKCPEVSLTVKEADPTPDYILQLNRQEEHGFLISAAISQIMLLRGSDQAILYSEKKGTVAKAVREGCKAIMADWRDHKPSPMPAATTAPAATPAPPATAGVPASSASKDKQWWQATNPPNPPQK